MEIRPFDASQLEAILRLSLRAWEPVFPSIEAAMGREIFRAQHPDWRTAHRAATEAVCADPEIPVWTARMGAEVAGFVALKVHAEDRMGQIYMIGVDPDFQRRGIATALIEHSLAWLRSAGLTTVMVETGADPGHAPARRTYESAGFGLVPVARYFKML